MRRWTIDELRIGAAASGLPTVADRDLRCHSPCPPRKINLDLRILVCGRTVPRPADDLPVACPFTTPDIHARAGAVHDRVRTAAAGRWSDLIWQAARALPTGRAPRATLRTWSCGWTRTCPAGGTGRRQRRGGGELRRPARVVGASSMPALAGSVRRSGPTCRIPRRRHGARPRSRRDMYPLAHFPSMMCSSFALVRRVDRRCLRLVHRSRARSARRRRESLRLSAGRNGRLNAAQRPGAGGDPAPSHSIARVRHALVVDGAVVGGDVGLPDRRFSACSTALDAARRTAGRPRHAPGWQGGL